MTPLLSLEQVRCSVQGVTLLDHVTLHTQGNRVGLCGKVVGIAELLTGRGHG